MTDYVNHVFSPLLSDRAPGRIVRSERVPRDAGRNLGEKYGLDQGWGDRVRVRV